jgi:hypothetical protein
MFWVLQIRVGSIVCMLVWYGTCPLRPVAAKALLRASPVVLTLAPGARVSGHRAANASFAFVAPKRALALPMTGTKPRAEGRRDSVSDPLPAHDRVPC